MANWNLSEFYDSIDSNKIINDLIVLSAKINQFVSQYKENFPDIDSESLGLAIEAYEEILQKSGELSSYAFLNYSINLQNDKIIKFYHKINEQLSPLLAKLSFFTLEIAKLDKKILQYDSIRLKHYEPWLRKIHKYSKYYLSEDLEKFITEISINQQHWTQLYDETIANIRIKLDKSKINTSSINSIVNAKEETNSNIPDKKVNDINEELNLEQALNLLLSPNAKVRKEIAHKISHTLAEHKTIFVTTYNALMKEKIIMEKWRKVPNSQTNRHLDNEVDEQMVSKLVEATKSNFADLTGRYYQIKAKLLGVEKLYFWDRNAPIIMPNQTLHEYSYEQAQNLVLESYKDFSPFMADIVQMFFDQNWIDAHPKFGKMGGGFAHPTVPSHHPYILLNYQKSSRDVMTLAHELGHGIHQYLAASQGYLVADTQLVLAEMASIFGEMLTFEKLLQRSQLKEQKITLLANKIEDKLNTVVRQVAFYEFECQAHKLRQNQVLSYDDLCEIWLKIQNESFCNSIILTEAYKPLWTYISHFIHQPFYVYAYAFSDCIVNNLYLNYKQSDKPDKFVCSYIEILMNGGRWKPAEVMERFGLDLSTIEFWNKGISYIKELINQLEALQ